MYKSYKSVHHNQ